MKVEEVISLASSLKAEIVETHISWVLLTKKYAYKIKKPIKTTFLNFSTLARRKKFCYRELELNKVLEPDIYLEVVGIKKLEKDFLLVPKGDGLADYAVKMKRLDSGKQMNFMLSKKLVNDIHIKNLAKSIASFHLKTKVFNKGKTGAEMLIDFKDLLKLKKDITDNLGNGIWKYTEEAYESVKTFLKKNEGLLLERIKNRFVRDCHGDLHSGNVFLYKDPVLFDRIEFNEGFRRIDVLHELGFLCMDLEAFGEKKRSEELLKHYIKFSGIDFGKKERLIFNYYKCYTANVRAKVNLLAARQATDQKKKYLKDAKNYLMMAFNYTRYL